MKEGIIQSLSYSQTSSDLWNEMYEDTNLKDIILTFRPNSTYDLRLLGPFVRAERLYVANVREQFSNIKINDILNGNETALNDALKQIKDMIPQKFMREAEEKIRKNEETAY